MSVKEIEDTKAQEFKAEELSNLPPEQLKIELIKRLEEKGKSKLALFLIAFKTLISMSVISLI